MRIRKTSWCMRSVGLWVLAAVWVLATAGCGPERAEFPNASEKPLAWPELPDQPRIVYLGAVSTERDMQKQHSLFDGLGELLFGAQPVGVLVCPYAVAVDGTGVMYVADSSGAVVHAFDLRTRNYHQFSSLDAGTKLQKPVALVTLADRIYVVDSMLRQVCVFKRNGEFLFSFGQGQLERPAGIACRRTEGMIYVADAGRHVICVFGYKGDPIRQIGSRGIGPGQFNFPTQLHIDDSGQLYVSDTLNYRIQVFGPDDRFLKMFGQQGDRPGNFAHPAGIATDSAGNVYVTDRQFENVQVFNPEGQILMAFGQEGSEPGQFWLPAGIFIDGHDRVYVADSFNKRVQIFELLKGTIK